jgi:hypothetical protein
MTNVTLKMSYSYHPQTDGQTEQLNQYLETFLRCFVHACPKDWSKWLPLILVQHKLPFSSESYPF